MLYVDRVVDRVNKSLIDKLPKMEIKFRFPNLYPGTRTAIVLKQPKTEGSIRNVYIPDIVTRKLLTLRRVQERLKVELGTDGYMDMEAKFYQNSADASPDSTAPVVSQKPEVVSDVAPA
jgi:hypothetical protein